MRYLMLCICYLVLVSLASAHELGGIERNNLKSELIKERASYDACIKKAEDDAKAQEKCRKTYALQRLFSVEELFHLYTEHTLDAENIYTDLHIAVQGIVHRVGESSLGFPEIVLALDAFGLTGVRCEFSKNMAEDIAKLQAGDKVRLGGISKGLFGDDFVRITHCEFLGDAK